MPVKIVTDSLADIPPELARTLGITVVPLTVTFGLESYRDGIDMTPEQFFARLVSEKVSPKTAQPSVGAFEEVYAALAAQGHDILSVHASSKLSGTFNSATQAAKSVHGVGIALVDTFSASLAEGLTVVAAARLAQAGAPLAEVVRMAQETASKVEVYFLLDTLEYLQKGGRIGKAQALVGTLLSIKPILTLREGEVHPFERARTRARAVERMKEVVRANGPYAEMALLHATTPDEMRTLAQELQPLCPDRPIISGAIGPAIGAYTGPGLLGVATRSA
jgi:DegV family protein with EDD domain